MSAVNRILTQIKAARGELEAYQPVKLNWYKRARATASEVVPWLSQNAEEVCAFVEGVYNSPDALRQAWAKLREKYDLGKLGAEVDLHLGREIILVSEIAGDVISRVLTDFIIGNFPQQSLKQNGKSDFPDLYLATHDYTGLPAFTRSGKKEYGAAMKGGRPVRVPDGIEIKTCRPGVGVDCHHPHMGLHLALCHSVTNRTARVKDIMVGFLVPSDYRESRRSTSATTVKFSFGMTKFVSVRSNAGIGS